jgi:hypothetical protein
MEKEEERKERESAGRKKTRKKLFGIKHNIFVLI